MGRGDIESKIKQLNPTILLTIVLFGFFLILLSSSFLLVSQNYPWFWHVPLMALQTLVVFLMFTPLHDGVHFQISKNRFLNEAFLFLCWPVFLNNPFLFRKIHFQHHGNTNKGEQDPDHFTSSRYFWKRCLKSFFLIFYYHWFSLKRVKNMKDLGHWTASVVFPVLLFNLSLILIKSYGLALLMAWLAPTFIGVGLLAYANTAWPHHPGRDSSRYRNTRVTYVPWLIQLVMLNQNLHLVHHLKPNIPWYQYPEYWKRHEQEIRRQGAQVVTYTKRDDPYSFVPQWAHRVYNQFWDITGF